MRLLTLVWLVASLVILRPAEALSQAAAEHTELTWKAALMTGDNQLDVFDNARMALKSLLLQKDITPENIKELSMNLREVADGAILSSPNNLQNALESLTVGKGDACLIHMTSHGTAQGFFMRGAPLITPERLNTIVDKGCGDRPTVLLISACYSGVFVGNAMMKPNRIILTAARSDLTSFGCSPENVFTYWDACLIDNLPTADTWKSLSASLQQCVETKETLGKFKPSMPQAFFGSQVADMRIPAKSAGTGAQASGCPVSVDDTYGYSASNPIRIGFGGTSDPSLETSYLNALLGPSGQPLSVQRAGTTTAPDATALDDNKSPPGPFCR